MKRKIALLASIMVLALSNIAFGFNDIVSNDWYYKEAMELKARGIVKGYEDGTFRASRTVSKAEALTMVLRGKDIEVDGSQGSSHWADGAVSKGMELGIISGEAFERDREARREEVAEMIVRALALENLSLEENYFQDSTNRYANILYKEGILKGEVVDGNTYFRPDRDINRAEMGALTVRVLDYMDSKNYDGDSGDYTGEEYFDFDKASASIVGYRDDGPKDVVIPDMIDGVFVRGIGENAFYKKGLTSVTIPQRVSNINSWAFAYNNLAELSIPETTIYVGKGAFYGNNLKSVDLAQNLLNIDSWAFAYNNMDTIYIPSSVRTIGLGSFHGNGMSRAEVSKRTTSIVSWAFDESTSLVRY